jgi:hypothetical protein
VIKHAFTLIRVMPSGFPFALTAGGVTDPKTVLTHTFSLPEVVTGSLSTSFIFYTNPSASLLQAVSALVREPHGCFEQTR